MTKHQVIRVFAGLLLCASVSACGPKAGAGGTRTAPTAGTIGTTGTGPSTGTGTGTGTGPSPTNPTGPGAEVGASNPGTAVAPPPG